VKGERLEVGAWLVDGDGHVRRIVRIAPGTVTLAGRATEQEFEVAADGPVVSDREFSHVEVEVESGDHGYVEGEGCPVDGESFESYRELL